MYACTYTYMYACTYTYMYVYRVSHILIGGSFSLKTVYLRSQTPGTTYTIVHVHVYPHVCVHHVHVYIQCTCMYVGSCSATGLYECCMLLTFLKYRVHYASNIIVAAPVQHCNYYVHVYTCIIIYTHMYNVCVHTCIWYMYMYNVCAHTCICTCMYVCIIHKIGWDKIYVIDRKYNICCLTESELAYQAIKRCMVEDPRLLFRPLLNRFSKLYQEISDKKNRYHQSVFVKSLVRNIHSSQSVYTAVIIIITLLSRVACEKASFL